MFAQPKAVSNYMRYQMQHENESIIKSSRHHNQFTAGNTREFAHPEQPRHYQGGHQKFGVSRGFDGTPSPKQTLKDPMMHGSINSQKTAASEQVGLRK